MYPTYDIAEKFQIEDAKTGKCSDILTLPELVDYLMELYYPEINAERRSFIADAVKKAYATLPNSTFNLAEDIILFARH